MPITAPAPADHGITPMIHTPAQQSALPSAKLSGAGKECGSSGADEQQQQTSREYRCTASAVDDLSELELDADTGNAGCQPPARPPAAAVPQRVSQKRPNTQAPQGLPPTSSLTKKHKTNDSFTPDPDTQGETQLAGLPGAFRQLAASENGVAGCAPSSSNTESVPMSPSSKQPPEVPLSLHKTASKPPRCQTAVTLPVALHHTTDSTTGADRTALPQSPDAAAGIPDSTVLHASQQLVLSSSSRCAAPSATFATSVLTCPVPATLSGAPAQQLLSTSVAASTCIAGKGGGPLPPCAPFGRSIVTLFSNSGIAQSSPRLHSGFSMLPKQPSSSYRPVIEELPSLPSHPVPTAAAMPTADPNRSNPMADAKPSMNTTASSKPTAIIIDIDSDDDHISAANTQPATSMQNEKPEQPHDPLASFSSKSAMTILTARDLSIPFPGQAGHDVGSSPAENNTLCDATTLASAAEVSLHNLPVSVGMGDIFSSFAALEDLSDAEEEEEGTKPAG
ncbi:hypothetical protein ABBQ38_008627 [Trebouxia sp. C0009 RCD-2024]